MSENRQVMIASLPSGALKVSDFAVRTTSVPEPGEGEVLSRTLALTIGAGQRAGLQGSASYAGAAKTDTVMTGAGVEDLKVTDKGVKAKIKDSKGKVTETEFSHCITAIGIVPNTEDIGLDKLADMEKGFIQIDDYGRTKFKGLWAIGDCTPGPWLAHKASHEGVTTAEAIAKELGNKDVHPHPLDRGNIPGCTYCHPQIASVGLTEAKAKEAGYEVKVGMFPFIGNGKAIALGEAEGFTKTVFDAKTGELLGAHMIGAEVTEMIQGYTIGKTLETTEAELMHTVFPHPTISESMHESVLAAYGRALHI